MADGDSWSVGFAQQAAADFATFEQIEVLGLPECHKLQFLQMACEKLVKAHLCGTGANPASVQTSHAFIAGTLPVVLRQQATFINYTTPAAREALRRAKLLAKEIEASSPSVDRAGQRPDNCEYPWEDAGGNLHLPLEWSFYATKLLLEPAGRTFLKLVQGAIRRMVS